MQEQSQSMQQLVRDQVLKEKGSVPAEFDAHFKKAMDERVRGMPVDEITEAMIPAYQKYFTKSEIEAMNTFYSSPIGQKVLQELPAVMQESAQAAMPIMSKYLSEWNDRMQRELKEMEKASPSKPEKGPFFAELRWSSSSVLPPRTVFPRVRISTSGILARVLRPRFDRTGTIHSFG